MTLIIMAFCIALFSVMTLSLIKFSETLFIMTFRIMVVRLITFSITFLITMAFIIMPFK